MSKQTGISLGEQPRNTFFKSSPWEMLSAVRKADTRCVIDPASPQWGRNRKVHMPLSLRRLKADSTKKMHLLSIINMAIKKKVTHSLMVWRGIWSGLPVSCCQKGQIPLPKPLSPLGIFLSFFFFPSPVTCHLATVLISVEGGGRWKARWTGAPCAAQFLEPERGKKWKPTAKS